MAALPSLLERRAVIYRPILIQANSIIGQPARPADAFSHR